MFQKICNAKNKIAVATGSIVGAASTLMLPTLVFASESSGVSTAMQTAFQKVATDFNGAVGVVAPIGLGIAGVFIVWKLGFKFFKSLAK